MLWTVFTGLPFEDRLAKVAEAGYTNVELVGDEYRNWSAADFANANAARKCLGIHFDATAGMEHAGHAHGLADPTHRDAFLAELPQALTPMETLSIPAMIVIRSSAPRKSLTANRSTASPFACCLSASTPKRIPTTFCNRPPRASKSSAP
jgi:sugar phosphate isomerase/epimerase